jgi:hypothetical protein
MEFWRSLKDKPKQALIAKKEKKKKKTSLDSIDPKLKEALT